MKIDKEFIITDASRIILHTIMASMANIQRLSVLLEHSNTKEELANTLNKQRDVLMEMSESILHCLGVLVEGIRREDSDE